MVEWYYHLKRRLVPVLLSVLIAVASLSMILQVCILKTLAGIASNPMLSVGSAKSTDRGKHRLASIPVTITNPEVDVNVQNYELNVNVQNTELDVRMRDHWILEGDPIPVTIVR